MRKIKLTKFLMMMYPIYQRKMMKRIYLMTKIMMNFFFIEITFLILTKIPMKVQMKVQKQLMMKLMKQVTKIFLYQV